MSLAIPHRKRHPRQRSNTCSLRYFLVLALGLMVAGGCIQMEHDLQIQGDGSAVYQLNYAISEQAISQFHTMFALRRDMALAQGDPPDPDPAPLIMTFLNPSTSAIREHIRAWEPHGISIRTLRENARSLWRAYTIVLDIADIQRLSEIPFFAEQGFTLERMASGEYAFARPAIVSQPGAIPPQFSAQELEYIRPFLTEFKTEVRIEVPGRITSTTAGRTRLQTAIWSFDFDRRPEAVHQLLQQQFHVVFHPPTGVTLPELRLPEQP